MTQEQEWQDELADIVSDSLDIDWNANTCAGHLLANGVLPPSVVAELVSALEAFLEVTKNPAPNAEDRKIQWLSVAMKGQETIALIRERVVLKGEG